MMFLLEPDDVTRSPASASPSAITLTGASPSGAKAATCPTGFDKLQKVDQAAIVENKRLGAALAYAAERQKERDRQKSQKAPRRRGQGERNLFAP